MMFTLSSLLGFKGSLAILAKLQLYLLL